MKKLLFVLTLMSWLVFQGCAKNELGKATSQSKTLYEKGAAINEHINYALPQYQAEWTHHPIFGEASFDNFERLPGNPVCRGSDDYRWPVNGSLFCDPISHDWFLYTGWYREGYSNKEGMRAHCRVYRSNDRGKTWQYRGEPIEGIGSYLFDGETSGLWDTPDVSVCYKDGHYHMSFDWGTKNATWQNAYTGSLNSNTGAAYAISDSPEGPFRPMVAYIKTRENQTLLDKYKRCYASSILPRNNDWIALTLTDSGNHFGWALLGQTASHPQGPWTKPKLLLHPQIDRYYPPLLEFFPQFVHDGYIYAPATSVAGNRNYQVLFRVPIERAMYSDDWEIYQEGSIWHAESVESEYAGIWGQTYSGFIDDDGMFYVMFPSRDQQNRGTINLARRPWGQPFRKKGFVISGHCNPSMTVLRHDTDLEQLEAKLKIKGTVQIIWNHHGPFGPDRPTSDSGLHSLMRTRFDALELRENSWALIKYDIDGKRNEIASGELSAVSERHVDVSLHGKNLNLKMDGDDCWEGQFESEKGRIGIWVEPRSHAEVETFKVTGSISETMMEYLHTEAIISAAQDMNDWETFESPIFSYGQGVVSRTNSEEVKWNYIGDGFELWAPMGPLFGKGELWLDGDCIAQIDFNARQDIVSHVLYKKKGQNCGRHALRLVAIKGRIPVDVLKVYTH